MSASKSDAPRVAYPDPSAQVSDSDRSRFLSLCHEAMLHRRSEGDGGFGTLAEKRLHAIIKRYLCPDEDLHEVGVSDSRYIADVRLGNSIYEVQTGSLYPLRNKIAHYLDKTDCTVTVVHPIIVNRSIRLIDPATHEISPPRRSPKHERPVKLLGELYSLLPYLTHPRLRFLLLLIDVEDFRLLNGASRGRKKGFDRYERIPTDLLGTISLNAPCDFRSLIPPALPSPFTVKDFIRLSRLPSRRAYSAVYALEALGLCRRIDPIGRAMAFALS